MPKNIYDIDETFIIVKLSELRKIVLILKKTLLGDLS